MEEIVKRGKITILNCHIQSGNNRILKLMKRYSDTEKIKDAFLRLKKAFPKLIIDTDVIAGFPTETEEEFKDSLNFIKSTNLDMGLMIGFSCKSGTEAEDIKPKIPKDK